MSGPPRAPGAAGVVMVGVSYHSAPIGLLERLVLPPAARREVLTALAQGGCIEGVVVSTGSRTEIYTVAPGDPEDCVDAVVAVLARYCDLAESELGAAVRCRAGAGVVAHLLRVAAGLDSRVLYDAQVLDQIGAAASESARAGMLGPELGALFAGAADAAAAASAFTTRRSASGWAVDVGLAAARRTRSLAQPSILVVGDEPAQAAILRHLAALGLTAHTSTSAAGELVEADIVVCAGTGGRQRSITREHAMACTRAGRRLTVVDTCLPRAADPGLAAVPGVCLLDLDDLDDDPEGRRRLGSATERAMGQLLAARLTTLTHALTA